METTPAPDGILLVDDGELDEVARVLDGQGIAYRRLRGGQIPAEVAPPRDLLIVTPRRVERVRRGSPIEARPGRPLRIIAVGEDSPAMRRRLRRSGLHLLIRLPADPEIWRLLVARALYRGSERREDPRVAVGSPVALGGTTSPGSADDDSVLLDLSNRGCRLRTGAALAIGDPVAFSMPEQEEAWPGQGALTLRGRVRRIVVDAETGDRTAAIVFDDDLEETTRTALAALINHWASGPKAWSSGPGSLGAESGPAAPAIPACQLASLPDLTLDDETDPPIPSDGEVRIHLDHRASHAEHADARFDERRIQPRARYASSVEATGHEGPFVLIGRDLSSGGMRIERHPDLALGDRFQLVLRGPGSSESFRVDAEIVRDDGDQGFGVVFDPVDDAAADALDKMVACLPDVESLEDGELAGLGAVLSEIVEPDRRRS